MARAGGRHDASHAAIAFIHVYFHPTNLNGLARGVLVRIVMDVLMVLFL